MKLVDNTGRIQWRAVLESDTALLAALPFFGSLLAFVYEIGYFSYFNVPADLIRVDFNRIIVAMFSVVLALWVISYILVFIREELDKGPLRRALKTPAIAALTPALLLYIVPGPPERWWWVPIIFLLISGFAYVSPLLTRSGGESYIDRLRKETEEELRDTGPSSSFMKELIVFSLLAFGIVFSLGRHDAEGTVDYCVLDDGMVVIRNYGDMVIMRKFDQRRRVLSGNIVVRKFDAGQSFSFSLKAIGPLPSPNPMYKHAIRPN
jgi:hypothetical protein